MILRKTKSKIEKTLSKVKGKVNKLHQVNLNSGNLFEKKPFKAYRKNKSLV